MQNWFDDKKLAMICLTAIACFCISADIYGVVLSSATQGILQIIIAGMLGAVTGYGIGRLEQLSGKSPKEDPLLIKPVQK